jgi:hypothetical protein
MTRSTVTPCRPEEGQRAGHEGAGGLLLLVRQELGVGEAGGIVDGDAQKLPAMPRLGTRRSQVMR